MARRRETAGKLTVSISPLPWPPRSIAQMLEKKTAHILHRKLRRGGIVFDPIVAASTLLGIRDIEFMARIGVQNQRDRASRAGASLHHAAARSSRRQIQFADEDQGRSEHVAVGRAQRCKGYRGCERRFLSPSNNSASRRSTAAKPPVHPKKSPEPRRASNPRRADVTGTPMPHRHRRPATARRRYTASLILRVVKLSMLRTA